MKKRVNGAWQTKSPLRYGTATDTLTSLPATVIPDGTNASADIIGNTEQNDTPTPDSPIMPEGTGDMTENLFDKSSTVIYNAYFNDTNTWIASDDSRSIVIPVNGGTQYTLSVPEAISVFRICEATQEPAIEGTYYRIVRASSAIDRYTFTTRSDAKYIIFQGNSASVDIWFNSLMLNTGSTPLPYEPYGYKLPISSANTTTPVYLGEVQTTRKIKKFVFNGTESFELHSYIDSLFTLRTVTDYLFKQKVITMCTHYESGVNGAAASVVDSTVSFYCGSQAQERILYVKDTNFNTAADFKTYLQQQYANGTPVTIWYVLATEETGIVNEPLMKIGDYADSVSVANIPTTAGLQTFDVDTTLKPSEVDLTYHGWHRRTGKEYSSGSWN